MVNIKTLVNILHKQWLMEALLWIIVFCLMNVSNSSTDWRLSIMLATSIELGLILLTHLNIDVLIPSLLERKRTVLYIFSIILLLTSSIYIFTSIDQNITKRFIESRKTENENTISLLDTNLPAETKNFFPIDINQEKQKDTLHITAQVKITTLFIGSFFFSFLMYYTKKVEHEERIKTELENERNEMELRFLRSQINPHFLFNSLNNIYSMVYTNDKNAPDCILTLSEMLRYVTDASKQTQILLRDEIKYIENYIQFQKYSFEKELNLTFKKNIESDLVYISPMLLEPFVENSFKYSGLGSFPDSFLDISLETTGNKLYFETKNSKGVKQKKGKTEREGIGIQNVEKRLSLLYPSSHKLEITDEENVFTVKLELTIETSKNKEAHGKQQ